MAEKIAELSAPPGPPPVPRFFCLYTSSNWWRHAFQYDIKSEKRYIACFGVFGNDVGLSAFRDTPLRKDRGNIDSSTKHEWLMITIRSHVKREVVVKALGASEQQRATANQVFTRREDFLLVGLSYRW